MKLLFGPGLIGTILSIFGCTPEPKGAPLIVEAAASPSACNVRVNNQQVTSQRLRQIASNGGYTWGIVRIQRDAPYKCVGAAVLTLQQAGLTTIRTEEWPTS